MTVRHTIGKIIGVLAGTACASLAAIFLLANPYAPVTAHDAGAWIVIIPGIGAAGIVAAIAALLSARRTLVALFVVSFFPFGLYLLATPSIWRWFGATQIGYVVAASLLKSKA